jgi:hypothetical protein
MAAGDGIVSMKPTSIAHSGTSASINADGGVDFTAVTELNLNGVFTSDYDNYLVVMNHKGTAYSGIRGRLRLLGTDASASDYAFQTLRAESTTVAGARTSSDTSMFFGVTSDEQQSGDNTHIYGPYLAQPTAFRMINIVGEGGAILRNAASTHSLSTSYDGITIFPASGSMTGTVHVFGYEE